MTEILSLGSSSGGAEAPPFGAVLDRITCLSGSDSAILWTHSDGCFEVAALHNIPPAVAEVLRRGPRRPAAGTVLAEVAAGAVCATAPDLEDKELAGPRSSAAVELRKDGVLLGAIHLYRNDFRPFAEHEILVVTGLATQAAVAIENARLIDELRQRTQDLREALDQQTATAEVLQIINPKFGS
jgi:GAF domain-containing protein